MNLILLCFLQYSKTLNAYISKLVLWHLSTSSTTSLISFGAASYNGDENEDEDVDVPFSN